MRSAYSLTALLLLASQANAYGPDATGGDWGKDYFGHPRHQAWVARYVDPDTVKGNLLDMCLDHISTGENEKVPKNVVKEPLAMLTVWCLGVIEPGLKDPTTFRDKTFNYPKGVVPLSD